MLRINWIAGLIWMLAGTTVVMADDLPTEQALHGNWSCEFSFKVGDKFNLTLSPGKFSLKLKTETIDGAFSMAGAALQFKPGDATKAATVNEHIPGRIFQYTAPAELVLGDGNPDSYCTRQ